MAIKSNGSTIDSLAAAIMNVRKETGLVDVIRALKEAHWIIQSTPTEADSETQQARNGQPRPQGKKIRPQQLRDSPHN